MIIEGKFADHPQAREVVLGDAQGRVQRGIANIAAAVVYPTPLRQIPTSVLLESFEPAMLAYCIVAAWYEGTPAALMDALRRAQEMLAQDDLVARIAQSLAERLTGVALLWMGQTGACDRLSLLLGMPAPKGETDDKAEGQRTTSAKVSALVLANALIFQEQLAITDSRGIPLRKLAGQPRLVDAAHDH